MITSQSQVKTAIQALSSFSCITIKLQEAFQRLCSLLGFHHQKHSFSMMQEHALQNSHGALNPTNFPKALHPFVRICVIKKYHQLISQRIFLYYLRCIAVYQDCSQQQWGFHNVIKWLSIKLAFLTFLNSIHGHCLKIK